MNTIKIGDKVISKYGVHGKVLEIDPYRGEPERCFYVYWDNGTSGYYTENELARNHIKNHYIGEKILVDYRNNRKPEEAVIVREDLGHYFAQHADAPHIMLDVTGCENSTSGCDPIIITK